MGRRNKNILYNIIHLYNESQIKLKYFKVEFTITQPLLIIMPKHTIAKSTLFKINTDGTNYVCHCIMKIDDPTQSIKRTLYTFHIWEWNDVKREVIDGEISEINSSCGNGAISAQHIITIENDRGLYTTPDYSPLRKISQSFSFIGWHGLNTDGIRDNITEYITMGCRRIRETLRRS